MLDLASVIPNAGLAPGSSSRVYDIRLRVGPAPADLADNGPYGVGSFSAKVFGKVHSGGAVR